MILYTIRDNVDPKYYPTCQFPARSMPQNGLLPFVQSFVCSIGNPCDPLSEYEEVPSYKNATLVLSFSFFSLSSNLKNPSTHALENLFSTISLGPLVVELQPMLANKTILSAIDTLPNSIQLLKSMAQILTRPEIKALFGTSNDNSPSIFVQISPSLRCVSNLCDIRSRRSIGRSVPQPKGNQESSQASDAVREGGIDRSIVRLVHKIDIRQYNKIKISNYIWFETFIDRTCSPGRFSADRGVRLFEYRRGYLLLGKFKEVSDSAEQRGLRGDLEDTL